MKKERLADMRYPKSCEGCVYRDKRNPNMCRHCSFNETAVPRFELERVDPFRLAEGLRRKQQRPDNKQPKPVTGDVKHHIELGTCSRCGQVSLFRNGRTGEQECLNRKCVHRDIFADVIWPQEEPES